MTNPNLHPDTSRFLGTDKHYFQTFEFRTISK